MEPDGDLRLLGRLVAWPPGADRGGPLEEVPGLLLLHPQGPRRVRSHHHVAVMRHSAVVIPTRNRHQMLFDAVHSVIGQVDRVVIVDNGSDPAIVPEHRSEEHTSELQSLMRISYAVFCLKKNKTERKT